jgi:hypothetical protein
MINQRLGRAGLLWLMCLLSPPVWAGMSLEEAVDYVQQETNGQVLSTETVEEGGQRVHRIKVLMPGGRVKVVRVDAR